MAAIRSRPASAALLQVLKSGLHVALTAESYVSGVRQSIMAGGDTTSRCSGLSCSSSHPAALLCQTRSCPRAPYTAKPSLPLFACEALHTICRAHVVGALLGAQHGHDALPEDWQKKAKKYMEVKQMAHIIIVQRKTFVPFHINRDPSQQPEGGR